ncbi:MAG: hypothetical protein ACYDHN_14060 [Solirubrobacteraceae bacterium]
MSEVEQNANFMLAAITDTEGTIRATDTKASIALVLHGLVFGGLLGVTERIGASYEVAGCGVQIAVVVLLASALVSSLASVLCLLMCVAPTPRSAVPGIPTSTRGLFFPPMSARGLISPHVSSVDEAYRLSVVAMDADTRLHQLISEVLALGAIRARKTVLIQRGLTLLGIEFVTGLTYLAVIGIHVA